MSTVISKDGTVIAYDKVGHGPAIILVNGALGYRNLNGEKELATLLSPYFSVIFYDRRGRGESKETNPYFLVREIEDIEALIHENGGSAFLQGASSGAALALLTAAKLGPNTVTKLSLYEPPYGAYIQNGKDEFVQIKNKVADLIRNERAEDAVTFFFESIGIPPEEVEVMKNVPDWEKMKAIAHTLVYDFEILGNGTVPIDKIKEIAVPTQILYGEKSFDFMQQAAEMLTKNISDARLSTLKDQTHQASAEALFPVLYDFFAEKNNLSGRIADDVLICPE